MIYIIRREYAYKDGEIIIHHKKVEADSETVAVSISKESNTGWRFVASYGKSLTTFCHYHIYETKSS